MLIWILKFGRPCYYEQLDTIDIPAMYKTTTPKRLLQNVVVEYEKFEDIRLVNPFLAGWIVDGSLLVVIRRRD